MFLLIVIYCGALSAYFDLTLAGKCERIDSTLLPACAKAGYNFTANFSNVGQQSYQAFVSSELKLFATRFKNCSPHSEAVICARYVPKCSDDVEGLMLPCGEVCDQFVDDCESALRDSGLYNRYAAYCGLLTSEKANSTQCFKPKGFTRRANITRVRSLPSCDAVTKPVCLTNNFRSLGNETRVRLQSSLKRLAPVLNGSCSLSLRRLACFFETGPCVTNGSRTRILDACQSLCQEVRNSCGDEFQRHNIFFPLCIPNYPEERAGDGLCSLTRWPVPRPTSGFNSGQKRPLQCSCTTCENGTCTTDGSCVIHPHPDRKHELVKRCLDKGSNRDLICSNALENKQNIQCCETDFCNRRPTTDKPTEKTTEHKDKGRVKKKNAPGIKPTTSRGGSDKKKSKKFGLSSGILATAVVGFLLVVTLVTLFLYRTVRRIRENSRARQRRNSGKYVHRSNISSNGRAVTIGDNNKGFEHANELHNGIALY